MSERSIHPTEGLWSHETTRYRGIVRFRRLDGRCDGRAWKRRDEERQRGMYRVEGEDRRNRFRAGLRDVWTVRLEPGAGRAAEPDERSRVVHGGAERRDLRCGSRRQDVRPVLRDREEQPERLRQLRLGEGEGLVEGRGAGSPEPGAHVPRRALSDGRWTVRGAVRQERE